MTRSETTGATSEKETVKRTRNPEKTRENILRVAMTEFADKGLTGARIDEIAAKTATTKRMLYYYFGDKEGLYRAVLQRAYEEIRYEESQLDVDHLEPTEAIRALAELTFDHHEAHPDFIRLVAIENTNRGANLVQAEGLPRRRLRRFARSSGSSSEDRRRASSAPTRRRSTSTCSSARTASSGWRIGTHSRRCSTGISPARRTGPTCAQ